MRDALFVTGASGALGRALIPKLAQARSGPIYCLSRRAQGAGAGWADPGRCVVVQGDICAGDRYAPALAECRTVIHLAAATGKATPHAFRRVNREGTQRLLAQCRQAGVENILFTSSIAVHLAGAPGSHYARSKAAAEAAVQESGLRYTIIRPTVIVGRGSGAWEGLRRLGALSPVPLFGGGSTRIQPIYIDDLAETICTVVQEQIFANEIYEMGGPETTSMQTFLHTIHRQVHGKTPRFLPIPLGGTVRLLRLLEPFCGPLLPVTAGQLAAFAADIVAQPNELYRRQADRMAKIAEMVRLALAQTTTC